MKETPHCQLLSHSEVAQLRLEDRRHDLRLRRQFSVLVEWMESSLNISNWLVEGLGGESQEGGVRSRPAESATGPIKKILVPHRGRVTV
jgi:hypothetical protein